MPKELLKKTNFKNHSLGNTIKSKHRLSEISHHFLSDSDDRHPVWKNTEVIPVLLGAKNDDHIVYKLDQSFNRKLRSSIVINIESQLATNTPLSTLMSSGTKSAYEDTSKEPASPEFCLIPVTSPSTTLALQSDRLILVVHASLGGVRIAYNQLAYLASLETDFKVSVIMLDAKTIPDAKRQYNFLNSSAKSLLALELKWGGLLLTKKLSSEINNNITVTKDALNNEKPEDEIATDIDGIVDVILRNYTRGVPYSVAASLSAPTSDVAAYLS